jgi:pyruvate/2-oxoglutarate dehydrogenase complex dihydrolipoamide dehydrogenase (E3) component
VILGSGSTAFAAALQAVELGKTAIMTESRTLGGTCVNRGCLPSKNLIDAAWIVWEARSADLQSGPAGSEPGRDRMQTATPTSRVRKSRL